VFLPVNHLASQLFWQSIISPIDYINLLSLKVDVFLIDGLKVDI
jgi:hypothetical protein